MDTSQPLSVAKLDASIVELTTLGNAYTSIGLAQVDLEGRGTLALATDGGVSLESVEADPFRSKGEVKREPDGDEESTIRAGLQRGRSAQWQSAPYSF